MELNKALSVVLELAEQNMLDDPEMQDEMLRQINAIESVRAHMQELESPSPLQVVLVIEGGVIQETYSNVPTKITVLGEDIVGSLNTNTDPTLVADILKEAFA